MDLPLNVSFASSHDPVDPAGNKAPKPPFLKRAIDWLRHILHSKHVYESDSNDKAYDVSNPGGPQPHKSNSPGNSNHHSSTTMAPGTSQGFPTPASSPGTSYFTSTQSTRQLAQSHEEQGSDHGYPRQLSGKKRARQEEGEEERNLGEKKREQEKKVKEPRFSKVKGDF